MIELYFLIPTFVVIFIFVFVLSFDNKDKDNELISKVVKVKHEVHEIPDSTLVEIDGRYCVLRLASIKGSIESGTKVLLIKYNDELKFYLADRYE